MLHSSHKAQASPDTGKRMTRAEAARHASLVRWKKESPLAANVQQRLAQIRAARMKKAKGGKGKAKGKAKAKAAKPKDARTPQEKANQNRAAVAKETGMADLEGPMVRIGAGMSSDQEPEAYDKLVEKGLAKRLASGKTVLTPAGKKFRRAADKGDRDAAREALSEGEGKAREGADKEAATEQKKTEREQARATRTAAREKRKAARGTKKPPADDKEKQAGRAQRQKEHGEDRAARLADRAQRQKEHTEDRTRQAKERTQRESARQTRAQQRQTAAKKDMAMSDYLPIVGDIQATIAELTELAAPAIKAGRRNNGSDQAQLDQGYELAMQLCDLFESLGANTGEEDAEARQPADDEAAEMKAIADDPVAYAYQECSGIQQASSALTMLAQLAMMEAGEQDTDTSSILAKIRQAMQLINDYIRGEIDEVKAIAKRDDVNPKAGVSQYGDVTFADAKNKKYPIDTPDHIRAAWNYISKSDNAGKYDPAEVATIKKAIAQAWKKKIDPDGPPSAETKKSLKGIEFYTHAGDEIAVLPGSSVKALGDGQTGGHLITFGGDGDLSEWRDVFDRATDYGRATKSDVYVHHRMLPGVGKRRLTNQAEIGMDDEGVFIKHLLDLRSSYERKLYGMVQAGKLGWSSGTAPHLVERKALEGGRHQIEQWPLGLDASYTPMPAGGFGVEARAGAMKSLLADAGIDLLHAIYDNPEAQNEHSERPDAAKAGDERARRLLLRARALHLQE